MNRFLAFIWALIIGVMLLSVVYVASVQQQWKDYKQQHPLIPIEDYFNPPQPRPMIGNYNVHCATHWSR
jgi:hypothetical protein